MKNLFKQIISDFHTTELKKTKKRELQVPLNTDKIITIIWPRRAGKSYFLFSIMHDLLDLWVAKEDILYINFEDERIDISWEELQIIIDAYLELYDKKSLKNTYFFFDEIQNISYWEKFVRRIYDSGIENIFITWSNAKLLSKEISTSLRGRNLSYELLPLSFQEFVDFQQKDINIYSTVGKANILNLQNQYLYWWWFPETIDFTKDLKIKTLQEYFDVMIYNDIVERYNIKDVNLLKQFIKQILQSTTKEYSINKIWNNLRSMGMKFDKNILYNFVEYIENIYLAKTISKYDYSYKKQTLKKLFLFDNGYMNAISFKFSNDYWKLLENAVFVELYRKYQDSIYFLKNWSETDFIVNKKEAKIYQVCYDLNNDNYEREIKGCIDAMEKFYVDKAFMITYGKEEIVEKNWKTIIFIPFYKWVWMGECWITLDF